jgi:PKD repeat protein
MHRRFLFTLSLALGLVGVVLALTMTTSLAQEPEPTALATWAGAWQEGPDMDSTIWGGPEGEGIARISGHYYTATNRVYILGGRRESNDTTGVVFYFDLDTRTYASTGSTLDTPISNYYVSQVEDGLGHGPGLYAIAGRDNAGTMINDVQVYYPDDNTVDTISAAPFPGTARLIGGQAVVDNQIYVFGGFDGASMFADTWVYSPTAQAWTDLNCDLPTPRSYIATAVVGDLIYAIGGDEFDGSGLIPLNDTVVFDTANPSACWQDGLMADLPEANGDAAAVYVDEGYLGGGVYVVGGYWPPPGPYRWVFRYDVATDTWEEFPELVIPEPATGRRNQALVYVPSSAGTLGIGDGVPGMWTFGGYDGSGTNASTNTSEFFSIEVGPVLLLPDALEIPAVAGGNATHRFSLINQSGSPYTFNLSYTSDVTWTTTLPSSVGPVADGGQISFTMGVALPAGISCPDTGTFTVTAVAQTNPVVSDTQAVDVRVVCGVGGTIYDATTGLPLEDAHVEIMDRPGLADVYYDAFTDENGEFLFADVEPGSYFMGASSRYYQPSFYPSGWPTGAITFTIVDDSVLLDIDLVGSRLEWDPGSVSALVPAGGQLQETLVLTNSGTGPLLFSFSELAPETESPPPAAQMEPERVDPQLYADLAAEGDGKVSFLVVLEDQAELGEAYEIADWSVRGEYVLNALRAHAELSQRDLREFLAGRQVAYRPLYVINAVIVEEGDLNLVNSLASRSDVAYLMANHRIPVEVRPPQAAGPSLELLDPTAVEWNITRVNADDVWGMGYTGQSIVVANIDTGVQHDHPALYRQYRGWEGGSTYDHNYNWYDPYHQGPDGGTIPEDVNGHGTHVMGTMVGDDGAANQIGMAPDATWIACDGGDNVSGYLLTQELLLCAEWILAPWDLNEQNPDPAMRPHVVNNSWGGGPNDYWFTGAVSAWRAAGIFPAFANGNEGPGCSTAHSPGDYWNSFAAGATDNTDAIASFSSRGPARYTGLLKPDISAPGVNVRSSVPGDGYLPFGGTSMASPHVAGAVALLWSADPELVGQIDTSGWILQQNAMPLYTNEGCGGDTPSTLPNNTFGYGLLDIQAAVNAVLSGDVTLPWLEADPSGGSVPPGGMLEVDLNFHAPGYEGIYTGTLWLVSDDPYNHDVRIPVEIDVQPAAPGASFESSSPDYYGETTVFTNTSSGSEPLSFLWEFGDGMTSTLRHPTHTYANLGTYTVVLSVTNSLGGDMVTDTVSIVDVPPAASFDVNATSGSVGDTFVFTNTSTGTNLQYLWDFGDGTTSTLENPTHVYSAGDIYTVTLHISNSAGSDMASVVLDVIGPPVADFISSTPDLVGETTFFTNTTQANPPDTSWLWVFGDGNFGTAENPTHVYSDAGLYEVQLTVSSPEGNDNVAHQVAICTAFVEGANFTVNPPIPNAGEPVTFEASITSGDEFPSDPVTYAWNFGDGGTGTGITVTHAFTTEGLYDVTVTASGPCGIDTYSDTLLVGEGFNLYLPFVLRNF